MNITNEQKDKILNMIKSGQKIAAIKYIRKEFGITLREAKRLADELDQSLGGHVSVETQEVASAAGKAISCLGMGCIGGSFGLSGLLLILFGIGLAIYNQQMINNGELVEAVVISDPHQPVFEYMLYGEKRTYQSSTYTDPPDYMVGDQVELYVNPSDPDDVLVNSSFERWGFSLILLVFGGILLSIGVGLGFLFKRFGKRVRGSS